MYTKRLQSSVPGTGSRIEPWLLCHLLENVCAASPCGWDACPPAFWSPSIGQSRRASPPRLGAQISLRIGTSSVESAFNVLCTCRWMHLTCAPHPEGVTGLRRPGKSTCLATRSLLSCCWPAQGNAPHCLHARGHPHQPSHSTCQ